MRQKEKANDGKMENHSLDNLVVGRAIRFHQSLKLWRNKIDIRAE